MWVKRLAILTVIFGALNIPASMDELNVGSGRAYLLFTLGMGLLGWLSYRVLAFFRVFSVDPALTGRPRRRK